jgi:hypothetical protein
MESKAWSAAEDAILDAHWAKGGPLACRRHGLTRSQEGMKARAKKRGIVWQRRKRAPKPEPMWALPHHDLLQSLECVRLRNWRGPVEHAPFVPALGLRGAA